MAWTDDIESQIKDDLRKKSNGNVVSVKAPANQNAFWLFGVIVLLGVVSYLLWQSKANSFVLQPSYSNTAANGGYSQWDGAVYNNPPASYNPYDYQPQVMPIDQRVNRLESAARKIWDRTKWNSDRLTLLATINNHNTVVIRNALPRQELILLNSDWTINRMPDRIQLDRQDQEFLKQYIRR